MKRFLWKCPICGRAFRKPAENALILGFTENVTDNKVFVDSWVSVCQRCESEAVRRNNEKYANLWSEKERSE